MLLQNEAVAAEEWQLSCSSPSEEGTCSAKALLQQLQVNPAGLTTDLPLLHLVPLTLTLHSKEVRIHLLAEIADAPLAGSQVPSQARAQALGVVSATSCQVGCCTVWQMLNSVRSKLNLSTLWSFRDRPSKAMLGLLAHRS